MKKQFEKRLPALVEVEIDLVNVNGSVAICAVPAGATIYEVSAEVIEAGSSNIQVGLTDAPTALTADGDTTDGFTASRKMTTKSACEVIITSPRQTSGKIIARTLYFAPSVTYSEIHV